MVQVDALFSRIALKETSPALLDTEMVCSRWGDEYTMRGTIDLRLANSFSMTDHTSPYREQDNDTAGGFLLCMYSITCP